MLKENPPAVEQTLENNKTTKKNMNSLGTNLRSARQLKDMSQEYLVSLMNAEGHCFTTSTISKIETRDRGIYDTELLHFLKVLGLSLEELINIDQIGK